MKFSDLSPAKIKPRVAEEEIRKAIEKVKGRAFRGFADVLPESADMPELPLNHASATVTPVISSSYALPHEDYLKQRQLTLQDFTRLAPNKRLEKHPVAFTGEGVLGYTILGWDWMVVRDDLYGDKLFEVELHESIHTPDEYETRLITSWMLQRENPTNVKYDGYNVKY